jgi:hypothetical protein
MADYYRLLSRVVAGIEKNNGANRRAIYDRARSAVVRQLRAIVPALNESDITRERLALEEAIRRVEAECERNLAVSRRLSPAEIRPVTARQWQPSLGSLPWRRGLHPGWNLNKVRSALWRAVYRIVFVSWLFSLCLLLAEGWFRSGWWDGKIALTLALSVLMRLADRLDTRFRPRSRPPVAARNRESGEIAVRARPRSRDETATLRPGIEPAHVALANQRATVLLLENLSDEQRRQYKTHQHFDVIGGESGTRYRIWHRPSMNVAELDGFGKPKWIWCFHPVGLVICDVLLAQKMALELFETEAIGIANRFSVEPYLSGLVALDRCALAPRRH